jgi:hypothetical protein
MLRNYLSALTGVLFSPKQFFQSNKHKLAYQSFSESVGFILFVTVIDKILVFLAGALGSSFFRNTMFSLFLYGIIVRFILSLVGAGIGAGILWMLCHALGARPSYRSTFSLSAAMQAFLPLEAIPAMLFVFTLRLGTLAWGSAVVTPIIVLWIFRSFVIGTIDALEVPPRRAWTTFGFLIALWFVYYGYVYSHYGLGLHRNPK